MAHVLLVEDDPDLRQLLQDVIAAAGHTADYVMTKEEADYLLAPHSHKLAICNVVLPDGSGRDVASSAMEVGIKTVLVSGNPDAMEAMSVAGIPYLAKPFRLGDLTRLIEEQLSS
jgi:two-component system OmpR family response regulator